MEKRKQRRTRKRLTCELVIGESRQTVLVRDLSLAAWDEISLIAGNRLLLEGDDILIAAQRIMIDTIGDYIVDDDLFAYDELLIYSAGELIFSAGSDIFAGNHVELGAGRSRAQVFTCDLTPEYVRINAEYTT